MKFTINTTKLQNLVARVIKGSSNDKLLPVTSLMEIRLESNKLKLTTTDMVNYFTMTTDVDSADTFTVVVMADNFAKLIAKMTSEAVTLELTDEGLTVSGGKSRYKIELPVDVDGSLVKLPVPSTIQTEAYEKLKVSAVQNMLTSAKSALATTLDTPCYTAYYAGASVLATDGYKICCIKGEFVDEPVLLGASTVDLLELMSEEDETEIIYTRDRDTLQFTTRNSVLISKAHEGLEMYSVDDIMGLVDSEFKHECVVKKNELLQALDRLVLFVGAYDRNVITLNFTKGSLLMQNRKSVGLENIDYISGDGQEFECAIDIEMFRSQVKTNSTDDVRIAYGLDNSIKIIDGDIVQIVALFME